MRLPSSLSPCQCFLSPARTLPAFSSRPFRLKRQFHDYLKVAVGDGRFARIPLKPPNVVGIHSSRGTRAHQEDAYTTCVVRVSPSELKASLRRNHGLVWDAETDPSVDGQLLFAGIYDGHGGTLVSHFLQEELHRIFEDVRPEQIPEAVAWLKTYGGYFRRWRGGLLAPWLATPPPEDPLTLEQRTELAFLEADRQLSSNEKSQRCGSTVSVAFLQLLEPPAAPFYSAQKLSLTVAHCGDTKVLLSSTDGGTVRAMTEQHHAETRRESARLRRMGGGLVTDSFGEGRWMGALANTRGLGDSRWKSFGVTPEPEIRSSLLQGDEWSHMVLVSDGVGSMASDQEIVDIVREHPDPGRAARAIVAYAEELGGEDNATALVVPLPGWGKIRGPDRTKELREYRRGQAVGSERQRRM